MDLALLARAEERARLGFGAVGVDGAGRVPGHAVGKGYLRGRPRPLFGGGNSAESEDPPADEADVL